MKNYSSKIIWLRKDILRLRELYARVLSSKIQGHWKLLKEGFLMKIEKYMALIFDNIILLFLFLKKIKINLCNNFFSI